MKIETARDEHSTTNGWFHTFTQKLTCIWDVFQDIGNVLKYVRLSLLVTLLAGLALLFTDQGRDILLVHAEQPLRHFAFYPAALFWAANAWYWARMTLSYGALIPWDESCTHPYLGGRLARLRWLVDNVPRLIGAGALLLVALSQAKAAYSAGVGGSEQIRLLVFSGGSFAGAMFFYVFVAKIRRPMSQSLASYLSRVSGQHQIWGWLLTSSRPKYKATASVKELPGFVKNSFVVLTAALVVLFAIICMKPAVSMAMGPEVVFLIGVSLWIAPGTWLLFVSKRGDFPVLSLLIVLAMIFSFFNDNHAVRLSQDELISRSAGRTTISQAVNDWRQAWFDRDVRHPKLVIVATAGGGSRAAYWTASVLGTIQDLHPDFDKQLFAVSGVSGGSVGSMVYRGLLNALPDVDATCERQGEGTYPYSHCAREVLGQDFLSVTLAAMLFPDLIQRFLPVGVFPDRGEALERAWESAWQATIGKNPYRNALAEDFLSVWRNRPATPALFFNGTSVATGKRIVTSNIDLPDNIPDTYDFFDEWQINIPFSTAANNSARFPIVAPAGRLPERKGTCRIDRIVDGGYFENFGAATALDLIEVLDGLYCDDVAASCNLDLVVIQISSDPQYQGVKRPAVSTTVSDQSVLQTASPASFAAELRSPIEALLNARTARGVLAAQLLHDNVANRFGGSYRFIEFRLDIPDNKSEPPLGWVLSRTAMDTMDCQLARPLNKKNFIALGQLLGFETEPFLEELVSIPSCSSWGLGNEPSSFRKEAEGFHHGSALTSIRNGAH